jgi:hypothetical protein
MTPSETRALPEVPPEAVAFAEKHGAAGYIRPLLELTRSIFPDRQVRVLFEEDRDAFDGHQIVIEVDTTGLDDAEALHERYSRWVREGLQAAPSPWGTVFIQSFAAFAGSPAAAS